MATVLHADFVSYIPLLGYIAPICGGVPASRHAALKALQEGGLVLVSPGGVKESIAGSTEDYHLAWNGRQGFAEMAMEANCPVVPMFTQNIRHVFVTFLASTRLVQWLYEVTKLPFAFFLGPFPVPLTTYFGDLITPEASMTAKEMATRVADAIQALMVARQLSGGSGGAGIGAGSGGGGRPPTTAGFPFTLGK